MLTYDDVMRLSGRELREAVAEHVMGWERWAPHSERWDTPDDVVVTDECCALFRRFFPDVDIAAAWQVVERLVGRYELVMSTMDGNWLAVFGKDGESWAEWGETAPLAICRAALLEALRRKDS